MRGTERERKREGERDRMRSIVRERERMTEREGERKRIFLKLEHVYEKNIDRDLTIGPKGKI